MFTLSLNCQRTEKYLIFCLRREYCGIENVKSDGWWEVYMLCVCQCCLLLMWLWWYIQVVRRVSAAHLHKYCATKFVGSISVYAPPLATFVLLLRLGHWLFSAVVCLLWSCKSCWLIDIFVSPVRICATTNILPVFCLEWLNMIMFIDCTFSALQFALRTTVFFLLLLLFCLLFVVCTCD